MNARQKAKKYKRMYEMTLSKTPVKFEIDQHKINTLRFELVLEKKMVFDSSYNYDYLLEVAARAIADRLSENFDKYVNYHTEFCPNLNKYRFCGEIKVVSKV